MKSTIGIKIGTDCTSEDNLRKLAQEVRLLREPGWVSLDGYQVFLVVSGAVKEGISSGCCGEYSDERMIRKTAAASGQISLMNRCSKAFEEITSIGQILVTYEELKNPKTAIALKETLEKIMEEGKIPVINYNDPLSVAVKESEIRRKIRELKKKLCMRESVEERIGRLISEYGLEEELFKDNDCLAAILAVLLGATRLLIITDKVDGLMYNNKLIQYACLDDIPKYKHNCTGKGGEFNTGGMFSKLVAAEILLSDDEEGRNEVIVANTRFRLDHLVDEASDVTHCTRFRRYRTFTVEGDTITMDLWRWLRNWRIRTNLRRKNKEIKNRQNKCR